jgi:predicted AlkP superfamily pyrophosphatase or phosphodiesterase
MARICSRTETLGQQNQMVAGYLPSSPDMRSSFFLAGKGIAAGRSLGEIHMEDIAPTLAKVLGVKLPAWRLAVFNHL